MVSIVCEVLLIDVGVETIGELVSPSGEVIVDPISTESSSITCTWSLSLVV